MQMYMQGGAGEGGSNPDAVDSIGQVFVTFLLSQLFVVVLDALSTGLLVLADDSVEVWPVTRVVLPMM